MINNNDTVSTLLLGNDFNCILFKVAIHFAESGLNVWCIAPESFSRIPDNIKQPSKEVLQLITFLYLKDYKDLIIHLNEIHMWHKIPNMIIVTGFESYSNIYSDNYNASRSALIITSILDSGLSCSVKKKNKSFILVTCAEPQEIYKNRLQVLKDLYFNSVIHKTDDDETFKKVEQVFQ